MKHLQTFKEFLTESYSSPSPTTKISGEYQVSWKNNNITVRVAGFERQNNDSDSLYLMDTDPQKQKIGSLIVKNKDMSKLEKGVNIKAKTTVGDYDVIIKRIGDL